MKKIKFLFFIQCLLLIVIQQVFIFAGNLFPGDSTGKVGDYFIVDVNNFRLPLNNIGMTARTINSANLGELNGELVLFSGGFSIAGKTGSEIWISEVLSLALAKDFLPGTINDTSNLSKEIYVVRKTDPPFGKSWQDWKDAVKFGARFYDGDFDGVYNPVDKNQNGIWDTNEDMPFLLGDITVWCVYNDSEQLRRFHDTYPVGIEVQQTVFASSKSHLQNTIFIMYSIINRGLISNSLDSVYFSVWADPDIGDYFDDLVGCDTTIFSSFTYNSGSDIQIGDDPPALFFTYLQGPKVVDTTLVGFEFSAINNFGFYYGIYSYEGYRNLKPSSFQNYIPFQNPFWGEETKFTRYNRIIGLRPEGIPVDPCNFNRGIVIPDTLCDKVNPLYFFSGDPVLQNGWINTFPSDQHNIFSIGPFKLLKDEPQHIIVAYTGAKGDNALNSITVGKGLVQGVVQEYKNNFLSITYHSGEPYFPVTNYVLYQNFPNPFNPSTIIRYQIPEAGFVTLKVYDVLGREVTTLVAEYNDTGYHEVEFGSTINGRLLTSGIYFYKFQIGSFSETKKMVILR